MESKDRPQKGKKKKKKKQYTETLNGWPMNCAQR